MAPRTRSSTFLKDVQRSVYRANDEFRTSTIQYDITSKTDREMRKSNASALRDDGWGVRWIEGVFREIVDFIQAAEGLDKKDKIAMSIDGGDLEYPVLIPLRQYHSIEFQTRMLVSAVEGIQQSKREWTMGCRLSITVTVVKAVQGRGRHGVYVMTSQQMEENVRTGVMHVPYPNTDRRDPVRDMCWILARFGEYMSAEEMIRHLYGEEREQEPMTWQEVVTRWCRRHANENVLVLSQQGEGQYHRAIWKSTFSTPQRARVIWYDEAQSRMLMVVKQEWLYGKMKKAKMCCVCGAMHRIVTRHKCSDPIPEPRARRSHHVCTPDQKERKTSVVRDDESENCLGRALYRALAGLRPEDSTLKNLSLEGWYDRLCMKSLWNAACGLEDVKLWAQAVNREYGDCVTCYSVNVYDEVNRRVIASFGRGWKPIYLNLRDGHFEWIKSMPAWIGKVYYCDECKKGYNNTTDHLCTKGCLRCGGRKTDHSMVGWGANVHCDDCNRDFWSLECYRSHKTF